MPEEERPRLAFWIHQVVEYLVGTFLFVQGVQSSRPLIPGLAGLVIVAVAASAQAPLSAFKLVSRPVHRVVDLVVLAVLVLLAATGWGGTSMPGRILLAAGAVAMAALLWRTDYRTPTKRRRGRAAAPPAPEPPPAPGAPAEAAAHAALPEVAADAPGEAVPEADAPEPPAVPATSTPGPKKPSTGEAIGRSAGRVVGQGVNAFRNRKR